MVLIIIPYYNTPRDYFKRCLYSVAAQTKDCHCLVVDDCSTSNNSEYARKMCEKLGIYYIRHGINGGPGAARQLGLTYLQGSPYQYVMFLDSDDELFPYAIELLEREAKVKDYDIVCSDFAVEHGSITDTRVLTPKDSVTWCLGKLYKKDFLDKNHIAFHPQLRFNEDAYFNTIAFRMTSNIGYVQKETGIWRENKNSLTHDKDMTISPLSYFKSQYYALHDLIQKKCYIDMGNLFGQLYNGYEECNAIGIDMDEINNLINSMPIDYSKIIFDNEFLQQFFNRVHTHFKHEKEIYPFKELPMNFLESLIGDRIWQLK